MKKIRNFAVSAFFMVSVSFAAYEEEVLDTFQGLLSKGKIKLHDRDGKEVDDNTKISSDFQRVDAWSQFLEWASVETNLEKAESLVDTFAKAKTKGKESDVRRDVQNAVFKEAFNRIYNRILNPKMLEKRLQQALKHPVEGDDALPKAARHIYDVMTKGIMALALYDNKVLSMHKGGSVDQIDQVSSRFFQKLTEDEHFQDLLNKFGDQKDAAAKILAKHMNRILSLEVLTKISDLTARSTPYQRAHWFYNMTQRIIDNNFSFMKNIPGLDSENEKQQILNLFEQISKPIEKKDHVEDIESAKEFFQNNALHAKEINKVIDILKDKIRVINKTIHQKNEHYDLPIGVPHYSDDEAIVSRIRKSQVASSYETWKLSPGSIFSGMQDEFKSEILMDTIQSQLSEIGLDPVAKSKSYDYTYATLNGQTYAGDDAKTDFMNFYNSFNHLRAGEFHLDATIVEKDLKSLDTVARIYTLMDEFVLGTKPKLNKIRDAELKKFIQEVDVKKIVFPAFSKEVTEVLDDANKIRNKYLASIKNFQRLKDLGMAAEKLAKAEEEVNATESEYNKMMLHGLETNLMVLNATVFGLSDGLKKDSDEVRMPGFGLSKESLQHLIKTLYVTLRIAYDKDDPILNSDNPADVKKRREIYQAIFAVLNRHLDSDKGDWTVVLTGVFDKYKITDLDKAWEWVQ